MIEAVRGNGYKGDIAVDDITLTTSACQSKYYDEEDRSNVSLCYHW